MYFSRRNNPQFYGYGCSFFGCLIGLMALIFLIQGSFYLLFRYFWLTILLGAVVWVFRKWIQPEESDNSTTIKRHSAADWHRDFENRKNTSYDNIERDFEEIEEEEEEQ